MAKKGNKPPIGPTRDPMEVGLDRYQRAKSKDLPEWVGEYGGLLGIGLVVAVGALVALGFSGKADSPVVPSSSAHLVISYGPAKVWEQGAVPKLSSVSLKVKNTSSVEARGVAVTLQLPGRKFPLEGPLLLAPGEEHEYTKKVSALVGPTEQTTFSLTCENCQS